MTIIQPASPATPIQPQAKPTDPASPLSAIPGAISEQDALKGGESAKIDPISMRRIGDSSNPAGNGSTVSLGSVMEAKLCLEIVDTLIPAALVLIFHAAKIQLNKSVFQLSAKEKDTLTPVLQKCLESINMNFDSPWTALAVTAGAIYIAKAAEHMGKAKIDEIHEQKKTEQAAKVAPMTVIPPNKPRAPKPAEQAITPAVIVDGPLRPWDEDDVKKVVKKRRKGYDEARDWLTKNWEKKGGKI